MTNSIEENLASVNMDELPTDNSDIKRLNLEEDDMNSLQNDNDVDGDLKLVDNSIEEIDKMIERMENETAELNLEHIENSLPLNVDSLQELNLQLNDDTNENDEAKIDLMNSESKEESRSNFVEIERNLSLQINNVSELREKVSNDEDTCDLSLSLEKVESSLKLIRNSFLPDLNEDAQLQQRAEEIRNKEISIEMRELLVSQAEQSLVQRESSILIQEEMMLQKEASISEREEAVEVREREVSKREEDLLTRTKPEFLDTLIHENPKFELELIDNIADEVGDKLTQNVFSSSKSEFESTDYIERESMLQEKEALLDQKIDEILQKEAALEIKELSISMKEEEVDKMKIEILKQKEQIEKELLMKKMNNSDDKRLNNDTIGKQKLALLSTLNNIQKKRNADIESKVLSLQNKEESLRNKIFQFQSQRNISEQVKTVISEDTNIENDTKQDKTRSNNEEQKTRNNRRNYKTTKTIKVRSFKLKPSKPAPIVNGTDNNQDVTELVWGMEEDTVVDGLDARSSAKLKEQELGGIHESKLVSALLEKNVYKINKVITEVEVELRKLLKNKGKLRQRYNAGEVSRDDYMEQNQLFQVMVADANDHLKQLQDRKKEVRQSIKGGSAFGK